MRNYRKRFTTHAFLYFLYIILNKKLLHSKKKKKSIVRRTHGMVKHNYFNSLSFPFVIEKKNKTFQIIRWQNGNGLNQMVSWYSTTQSPFDDTLASQLTESQLSLPPKPFSNPLFRRSLCFLLLGDKMGDVFGNLYSQRDVDFSYCINTEIFKCTLWINSSHPFFAL